MWRLAWGPGSKDGQPHGRIGVAASVRPTADGEGIGSDHKRHPPSQHHHVLHQEHELGAVRTRPPTHKLINEKRFINYLDLDSNQYINSGVSI